MPKIIFQPLMICNPPSKNATTYCGSADFKSAAISFAVLPSPKGANMNNRYWLYLMDFCRNF